MSLVQEVSSLGGEAQEIEEEIEEVVEHSSSASSSFSSWSAKETLVIFSINRSPSSSSQSDGHSNLTVFWWFVLFVVVRSYGWARCVASSPEDVGDDDVDWGDVGIPAAEASVSPRVKALEELSLQ